MSHPLEGANLRLARADKHLAEADELICAFADDCVKHVVTKFDYNADRTIIRLTETPPLPPMLALAVSDTIHNMRAALDYIVYELALCDAGTIQQGTQFLIEDLKRGFDARRKNCLRGLNQRHIDLIESLQPYNGVEWTRTLRDISNPDKHRQLTALTDDEGVFIVSFHPPTGGSARGHFEVDAHQAIFVAPPDRSKPPLMTTLRSLEAEVNRTIELFTPEF